MIFMMMIKRSEVEREIKRATIDFVKELDVYLRQLNSSSEAREIIIYGLRDNTEYYSRALATKLGPLMRVTQRSIRSPGMYHVMGGDKVSVIVDGLYDTDALTTLKVKATKATEARREAKLPVPTVIYSWIYPSPGIEKLSGNHSVVD